MIAAGTVPDAPGHHYLRVAAMGLQVHSDGGVQET